MARTYAYFYKVVKQRIKDSQYNKTYYSYKINVPSDIAERIPEGSRFIARVVPKGILYEYENITPDPEADWLLPRD
jgi:hypothetical protein